MVLEDRVSGVAQGAAPGDNSDEQSIDAVCPKSQVLLVRKDGDEDGRFTAIMPHPERVFRTVQWSWHPDDWGEDAPWIRLFRNARLFVGVG